jgi:hypothetical protein
MPNLPLEDALQLVHLYAERGSPRYEKAAMRGSSGTSLKVRRQQFAEVATESRDARMD